MINWHRLFGLTLCDYFTGTAYQVELEKDIARKRQVLDVLIIRGEGSPLAEPCDGLEALRPHNLLTYKSAQESLDAWAIEELIGHYVNYRKAFAPKEPAEEFGLYAVSSRHPRELLRQVPAEETKPGVYRMRVVNRDVTIIVPREVEVHPRNALWELFSFEAERVALGASIYQWRQTDHANVLAEIYLRYHELEVAMSYTFEDFHRDFTRETLKRLSPEERLQGLSPEEIFRRFSLEDRLKGLDEEERAQLKVLLEKH